MEQSSALTEQTESILPLSTGKLAEAAERVTPLLQEFSETQLTNRANVSKTLKYLRVALWDEVSQAEREDRTIIQNNIWRGICCETYWLRLINDLDDKLAYVLCPVKNYDLTNRVLLHVGQQKLFEIMEADIKDKDGKLNVKAAALVIKAYKEVENRVKGESVKRIETKTQTIPSDLTPQQVDEELKRLEGNKAIPVEYSRTSES